VGTLLWNWNCDFVGSREMAVWSKRACGWVAVDVIFLVETFRG